MQELTDEEIWELLVENRKLIYFFANKMAKEHIDVLVSYIWEEAFTRIKAGDLEKGSLSQVINYATLRSRRRWLSTDNSYAITLTRPLVESFEKIQQTLNEDIHADVVINRASQQPWILKNEHAHVAINAMRHGETSDYVWDSILHVEKNRDISPNAHIILGTGMEPLFTKEYGLTAIDIFTSMVETRHTAWDHEILVYVLARRYGLEIEALKVAPTLFRLDSEYDLVTPLSLNRDIMKKINRNEELTIEEIRYARNPKGTSLRQIGEELNLTRERIRQLEIRAIDVIREIYDRMIKELE